jgi:hypothetical protein
MINKTPAHLSLTGFLKEKSPDQISSRYNAHWMIKKYNPGPLGKTGTHWISFVNTPREVY